MRIAGSVMAAIFACFFLLAGQFVWLAPALGCAALLLWAFLIPERRIYSSPIFWLWLAFLLLVSTQLLNAGQSVRSGFGWLITFPSIRWLPFTLYPRIAFQFFNAWLLLGGVCVALELPVMRRYRLAVVDYALVSAAILAIMGVTSHYFHLSGFFWGFIPPDNGHLKFAVFGYVNNAATFFMLASALAFWRSRLTWPLVLLFGWCIWICDSRAMLAAWGLLALFAVFTLMNVEDPIFTIGLLSIVALAFAMPTLLEDRWYEYLLNWRLFVQAPVFGLGIHSNTLLIHTVAEPYLSELLMTQPNTHNDIMVWLVEYGIVGVVLLGAIGYRLALRRPPAMLAMGLMLACGHAMIDMPLRCPAVVLMMLVLVHAERRLRTRVSLV